MAITFRRTGAAINDDCMTALREHGIPCKLDNCLRVIAKMADGWHLAECWRLSSSDPYEYMVEIDKDDRFIIKEG